LIINKRRAVATQTARCRSKVLYVQYVHYFRAYQRSGREDTTFAENSKN